MKKEALFSVTDGSQSSTEETSILSSVPRKCTSGADTASTLTAVTDLGGPISDVENEAINASPRRNSEKRPGQNRKRTRQDDTNEEENVSDSNNTGNNDIMLVIWIRVLEKIVG